MKILIVSVEVAPFAKVGGLADVAGSLPKALRELGHEARIVMPAYPLAVENSTAPVRDVKKGIKVPLPGDPNRTAFVQETELDGVPVYLIGTDDYFTDATTSAKVYAPGSDQYVFFNHAILKVCEALKWIPEVLHANDWHTGLLPVLLRETADQTFWRDTASVFTIHNLAYQGVFGPEILEKSGLGWHLWNMHQLETWGTFNFLKSGCVFADQVNTVSERYAGEIQSPEYGCGLYGLMGFLAHQGRLSGILNGLDTDYWNPASDPLIAGHFSAENLAGKAKCRDDLFRGLEWEPIEGAPVAGVVSRLSEQKGLDLILAGAEEAFALPMQMVIQGLGDPWLADRYTELQKQHPKHFRFVQKFDVASAQRIYAGCDLFLMPSSFEPCGLGQMIAMRYGTLPLVRETGGLADTVFEGVNGFVFQERSLSGYLEAVRRAHAAFGRPELWAGMVQSALRGDYSWAKSARAYGTLYERALETRQQALRESAPVLVG